MKILTSSRRCRQQYKKETAIRLISGQGGSGKRRLAAELAVELRKRQYSSGFLNLGIEEVIRVREKGLVGIIDLHGGSWRNG
jgi:hypothetical protein